MDKVDEQIIAALKDDSRVSLAQLARQVHKSRTAVESRVQKLIEKGIILGFTINVAADEEAQQSAFLMLTLNGSNCHLVFRRSTSSVKWFRLIRCSATST